MSKISIKIVLGMIYIYQKVLSPMKKVIFGPNTECRFYPSCSEYGRISFKEHGFCKGLYLTIFRLFRCHPFNEGGYDPVPTTFRIIRASKEKLVD